MDVGAEEIDPVIVDTFEEESGTTLLKEMFHDEDGTTELE